MNQLSNEINPFLMYGTAWKEDKTQILTLKALECGFRALDTANQRKHYFEKGVGMAVKSFIQTGQVIRNDLFIQTKFTYKEGQDSRLPYDPGADNKEQVWQSFQSSLKHLNTDYIDSYILHGPSTNFGFTERDVQVWEAIEELHKEKKTRHIGVSNISAAQLQILIDQASVLPNFVQNRCFAKTEWDQQVRNICRKNKIIYQGFSLLTANSTYLRNPKIIQIAEKYEVPPTSIIFGFAKQIGILPLTGTTNQEHMNLDLSALDLILSSDELQTIEKIALI